MLLTTVSVQIENLVLDTGEDSLVLETVDISSLPNYGVLNIDILDYIDNLEDMKDKHLVADIIDNLIVDEVSDITGFLVSSMTYSIL